MTKLKVTFLFHMHQPFYKALNRGKTYVLPWVFLHAIREYYDVAMVLNELERIKIIVNFSPALLIQLKDYEKGVDKINDQFLELIKIPPDGFSEEDYELVTSYFFMVHPETQLKRFKGFIKLKEKVENGQILNTSELFDLQVLYLLSHMSELELERNRDLKELASKDKNFSIDDKNFLLETCNLILKRVLPLYRKLHKDKKIELSMSPYFHPILPLILNTDVFKESNPNTPYISSIKWPEVASWHIEHGMKVFKEFFDFHPIGIWPSEGAVSEETLNFVKNKGFKWIATDQRLLKGNHFTIYDKNGLTVFFRDTALSDRIGFVYNNMPVDKAVQDFIGNLNGLKAHGNNFVFLAFDGENPWNSYKFGGMKFLRELLKSVETKFQMVTPEDLIESKKQPLGKIKPGSWVDGTLKTWMGHPEKNRAWLYLKRTKEAVGNELFKNSDATLSFMAATGSDWFWWLGDDNPTPFFQFYDFLFREHLKNVYLFLNLEAPEYLYYPIKVQKSSRFIKLPINKIKPEIDGKITHYLEWHGSGEVALRLNTVMKGGEPLQKLFYGFDEKNLYLRLDPAEGVDPAEFKNFKLSLKIDGKTINLGYPNLTIKAFKIIEIALPLEKIKMAKHIGISFEFVWQSRTWRYPEHGFIWLDLKNDWLV